MKEFSSSAIKKALPAAMALSLAATLSSHAQTVGITDISDWNNAEVVNLDLTSPALGSSGYNGGVYAGINTFQLTAGTQTFDANGFCIDPYHWSVGGAYTDNVLNLSSAPKAPGPMSATAALQVEDLWAMYYTAALTSSSVAGGLQLAIWEVVANSIDSSEYFSLDSGQSGAGQIGDVAALDIASLTGYKGPAADLVALSSSTGQDYVVENFSGSGITPHGGTVPDGGKTMAMFAFAIAGLAAFPRFAPALTLKRIK